MGNHASRRRTAAAAACKVVLSDGSVAEFEGGTSAAELMLEHPQQVVAEFSALLSAGSKASPLPADHRLEPGRAYVMLPVKRRNPSTVSAEAARRALSRSRSVLRSSSFPSPSYSKRTGPLQGFSWGRPVPGGAESDAEGEGRNKAEPAGKLGGATTEVFGDVPELPSRQLSGRLWKPSLHTIVERAPPTKVSHWLF